MNYFWTTCPGCSCQVAIQYAEHPDRISGSLRRWSGDRATNDGRRLEVPRAEVDAAGDFPAACVCGRTLTVRAADVERASTERPAV